jgi:hypothetical protein
MVQGQRINQLLEAESASTSTLTHCSPQILVVAAHLALLFHHLMLLALASHRVSLCAADNKSLSNMESGSKGTCILIQRYCRYRTASP